MKSTAHTWNLLQQCYDISKKPLDASFFWACDAPLEASLCTSVSHRDLAAMDVNKERKES